MNVRGAAVLAWRYVARHRVQSLLLAGALGIVLALPMAVSVLVAEAQSQMRSRALNTPLVAGPPGSATDLLLSALHFRKAGAEVLPMKVCDTIRDSGLAEAIPLNIRFHAQGAPIVGTELEYFEFRGLKLAEGHQLARLGDCVLGANIAKARRLGAGGEIYSSPEQVFDLSGIYPLKMKVVGVFAATGSPDDDAVFVDIKTAWLIAGIAHGHDDLAKPDQAASVLSKEQGNVVGNAAVKMFNEVTDANIDSFHFHGDPADFPMNAAIILPNDRKAEAILVGRYQTNKEFQVIRPVDVLDVLLATLFKLEKLIVATLAAVAVASLLVAVLVFGLSFRLRHQEFSTLAEIGVGKGTLVLVKVFEVSMIGVASLIIAGMGREIAAIMAHAILLKGIGG